MKSCHKALWFAIAAVLLWSTVASAFKIALRYMDALTLLFLASLWSAAALFLIILIQKEFPALKAATPGEWGRSFLLGLLNPVFYYLVLFRSYELLPAQIAQPLNYTWPVVLVLLSAPLLGQSVQKWDILSLGLCFAGILLISRAGGSSGEEMFSVTGIILALFSSVIWAVYWIFSRKSSGNPAVRLFQAFLSSIPVLILMELLIPRREIIWTWQGLTASAYVGFFEMGVTFVLWSGAMGYSKRTADIGNLVYISPFLSLIWISLLLKEQIFLSTVLGLGTIVGGILLGNLKKGS